MENKREDRFKMSDCKILKIKSFHLFKLQVNSIQALTYTAKVAFSQLLNNFFAKILSNTKNS